MIIADILFFEEKKISHRFSPNLKHSKLCESREEQFAKTGTEKHTDLCHKH